MVNSSITPCRNVLITGVSRGLGRAMADGFSKRGHTVIGCGRDAGAIAELKSTHGAPHRFDVVNVADDQQVAEWARDLLQTHGAPDLLINCAALMNTPAPLWSIAASEFDALIDTNIKGVANVIRHLVPSMVAAQRGVIVNFSSGWGRGTCAGVAPYCASKWAIEGLTRALAKELPKGMAAIPLDPGMIATDMLNKVCAVLGSTPGKGLSPGEWAKKVVPFLLAIGAGDNGRPLSVD